MDVELTQFLLPDGRRREQTCTVSDTFQDRYHAIRAAGCRLTCEVLSSGMVSLAVEHPSWGDFLMEVCRNEPDRPPAALEKLIGRFDLEEFSRWLVYLETTHDDD